MSDDKTKTLEERVVALEARIEELERKLRQKADQQQVNKQLSDLSFAVKNHRL